MQAKTENIMTFPEKSRYKQETATPWLALYKDMPELYESPVWLKELRYEGLTSLEREGLPTPRLERWKYTNIMPQIRNLKPDLDKPAIVYNAPDNLVHNLWDDLAETPDWLVTLLAHDVPGEKRYGDMALWHLGNLFMRDGLVVDVPAGKAVDRPVDITISGKGDSLLAPQFVIRLGEGAELTIIEQDDGEGAYWLNSIVRIEIGANARLRHYRIQENPAQAIDTRTTHITLQRDASYEGFTLTAGAGLSRNQIHAQLLGDNATCNLSGVNILHGSQLGDTTIEIEHRAEHCNSGQFIRSVLNDQAHGVFQGKAYVHEGAQKTDAFQLSNALLLSEGAEMDTKPELEIYADDVKCSHGATTGKLEDEPLFYLRSRGLPEKEARALLIHAFVGEVVEKLADESVKELISAKVEKWLD